MKSRSLLCGAEGWITYSVKFNNTFNHVGYVWSFFKKILTDEIKSKIRGLKAYKTMDGCVFDYPEEGHEIFEEIIYNDRFYGVNYNLIKLEKLPEMQDDNERDTLRQQGFNGNSHGNGGFNRNGNGNSYGQGNGNRSHNSNDKLGRLDIFIGNLPFNADEANLKQWIESQGVKVPDLEVRFAMDKETNKPRGFGFVSVYDKSILEKIVKLNGKMFNQRSLNINEAKK